MVPKIVPSIVRKAHIFSTEIPFSILKDKSGDKSQDNFGSWYTSENKSCISGLFWGPFSGPFFSFGIVLQVSCFFSIATLAVCSVGWAKSHA